MKKYIIISLIAFLFYACIRLGPSKEIYKNYSYKGIIKAIYRDPDNHDIGTYLVKNDSLEFEVIAENYSKSWYYAKVGDSIIKPVDTLMIIIKKNDSTFQEFVYDF